MAELRATPQNRLLGQLARMLRTTEGDIAAPEFLPKGLDLMGLVRQLMLPSAETVEKLSYGDPLFRMPTQSNIPITADREYLADVAGMIPFGAPAARPSARAVQDLVRQIQTEPPTGAITPRASLLDQPAQSLVEAPKFEMPSFAALRPETEGDIDQIYDFVEQQAKKAGYRVKSGASNISGSRYLTITEDLPDDDIRDIELRISDHGDRHSFSDATEGKISIDPSRGGTDLEAALYELQEKGFNLLR